MSECGVTSKCLWFGLTLIWGINFRPLWAPHARRHDHHDDNPFHSGKLRVSGHIPREESLRL